MPIGICITRNSTTEKTLTVTVTKNPDDDEALRITTADAPGQSASEGL
jgi:hypothetical protein